MRSSYKPNSKLIIFQNMLGNKNIKYLGFGSPLMDMIADVNEEIIKKYNYQSY